MSVTEFNFLPCVVIQIETAIYLLSVLGTEYLRIFRERCIARCRTTLEQEVRMETQTGLPHATGFGERFHRCLFYQKERSALGTLLYMRILRMIGIVG